MKEVNAVIHHSANTADEEKRSYSDFTAVAPWTMGSFILTEDQLLEKLQSWLSPPDPSTNHNIARKAHHKGTASWFFQGSIFKQWKSSPSLLWIHGKRTFFFSPLLDTPLTPIFVAGSGKSVLWSVFPVIAACVHSYYRSALR